MANVPQQIANKSKNFKSQENDKDFAKPMTKPRNIIKDIFKCVDEELWRPYKYITSVPGKNVRINLIGALNYWMTDVPKDTSDAIAEIVQHCHNGSLLIDDIQDRSLLRRGVPTAHTIFGVSNTVNSADYLLFAYNLEKVMALKHPKALRIYYDAALDTIRGQGLELYWRDNFICPTEEEYIDMINKKTGTFFTLGKELMKLFCKMDKNVDILLTAFGQYFQILDDYNSLNNQFYFESKGVYCEDITEGKFGFPTVHAVNNNPEVGKILISILRERTYDVELKKKYISLVEECGSFEYTKKKIKELTNIIAEEYEKLGENYVFKDFMAALTYYSL